MASHNGILAMGITATIVNLYGAVKKGRPIELPVFGGFVVVAILLGIGNAAPDIGKLFALAFLITSLSENGTTLLGNITQIDTTGVQQSSPGGSPDIQRKV